MLSVAASPSIILLSSRSPALVGHTHGIQKNLHKYSTRLENVVAKSPQLLQLHSVLFSQRTNPFGSKLFNILNNSVHHPGEPVVAVHLIAESILQVELATEHHERLQYQGCEGTDVVEIDQRVPEEFTIGSMKLVSPTDVEDEPGKTDDVSTLGVHEQLACGSRRL
ncbi:hypothetical protein HAX54_043994 [Datura stramonium]|uniref:Uncharacterized protein n=1 Tax=Datura stramonium TaxID=4076 RepID=A0ABS8SNW9_DATST|nr:hypothetical protein [Datura stramonium]